MTCSVSYTHLTVYYERGRRARILDSSLTSKTHLQLNSMLQLANNQARSFVPSWVGNGRRDSAAVHGGIPSCPVGILHLAILHTIFCTAFRMEKKSEEGTFIIRSGFLNLTNKKQNKKTHHRSLASLDFLLSGLHSPLPVFFVRFFFLVKVY